MTVQLDAPRRLQYWYWTYCGNKKHLTTARAPYHCDVVRAACGIQLLTEHPHEADVCRDCERRQQAGNVLVRGNAVQR